MLNRLYRLLNITDMAKNTPYKSHNDSGKSTLALPYLVTSICCLLYPIRCNVLGIYIKATT